MKRPILYILIPLILGIATSHLIKIGFPFLLFGFVLSAVLGLAFLKNRFISHLALYLAVFFLGMACYQNALVLPRNHIANFTQDEPNKIFLKGVVIDDPATIDTPYGLKKTSFVLKAQGLGKMGQSPSGTVPIFPRNGDNHNWQGASGLVKVDLYSKNIARYDFGDELILEGSISKPRGLKNPKLFDYSKYLEIKGIYSVLKVKENFFVEKLKKGDRLLFLAGSNNLLENSSLSPIKVIAYKFRRGLRHTIDSHFDGYYASFLKAIFIGDRTGLGDDIKDDFIKTGTVHILAISGLHVGLIAGIVLAFFGILRIPKRWNLVLTLIFLVFYTFAAGANPPIVRAVVMFCIFVIGYLIQRETDLLNSLSAAGLLILLWNPKELFDPGFQLSFISVASIIILCPVIDRRLGIGGAPPGNLFGRIRLYALKSVSISIAAWLGTSPVIAAYFNMASPVSIIANLIVIPILFVLTAISFVFFIGSQVSVIFGAGLSGLILGIEQVLFLTNHLLSRLPLSNFRVPAPSGAFLTIYYAFISLLILPDKIELIRIKVYKKHIFIVLLCLANIFVWLGIYQSFRPGLKITFLDVGQGDSAFIRLPRKGNILIDGGPGGEENRFDTGRSVIAPYLWNEAVFEIDAVVISHFDEDHLGGIIYILNNFKVGCVIDNGAKACDNRVYDEYLKVLRQKKIRHVIAGEGDTIETVPDVKIFVLNPVKSESLQDSNDKSIVLKLVYKNFSSLLCGDVEDRGITHMASYGNFLKSDVMKVPHHGLYPKNSVATKFFFELISPKICIISVGWQNRYGAPSQKTIDIIASLKSTSYDTKSYGAIELFVDSVGYGINTYVERKN